MGKTPTLLICLMSLLPATCCSKMKQGVGLQGVVVDEYRMTLEGDTFSIRDCIYDRLFIVRRNAYSEGEPCYLIKRESNGFYYIQAEEKEISFIDGTERFVVFGNGEVFDIESKGVLFRTDYDWSEGFAYLGTCGDIFLFGNMDALCFSDGTHIYLQPNAYHKLTDDDQMIHFTLGAQYMDISPSELRQQIGKPAKRDNTITHTKKGYFVRPRTEVCERIGDGLGFDVDMDVPSGSSTTDIAVRQWMMTQIRNDAFDLLECSPEEAGISECDSVKDMLRCLDLLGDVWEKTLRNAHVDTLYDKIDSHIMIRKIVDCKDYVTYYFSSMPYTGGIHALPRSYYATYDKRRNVFLTADNTVKKEARRTFATMVLRSMKKQHDDYRGQENEWQDYTKAVFSGWGFLYCCDKNTEWKDKDTPYNLSDFPLPHLAIIPEGVVLTYHPYQIDCFGAGEYHAVVPLKDVAECLRYQYKQDTSPKQLDMFIKMREK